MMALVFELRRLGAVCALNSYKLLSLGWVIKSAGGVIMDERQKVSKGF